MAETKAMFIQVEVDPAAAGDAAVAKKLAEVCPVNIFETDGEGKAVIVEGKADTAAEKLERLKEAGISVAEEISAIPDLVREKLG